MDERKCPVEGVGLIMLDLDWYKGKRVFVTGHTGFKGSWMCRVLQKAGAEVTGYALNPPTEPALFDLASLSEGMHDVRGDIRDLESLQSAFRAANPEIVIHMAAQPIVRESYRAPRETYETNVMGTVNLLECVRLSDSVRSVVNVTTDKVYLNREWPWGYREDEMLDGFDPYSNSKSCSELVTHSYVNSFFQGKDAPVVSTARAGNVIGGGDFASDRIIPDCVRAVTRGETIHIRNPYSTRPYQHVLEPVCAYLMIAQRKAEEKGKAGWYNVGPDDASCVTTGELVNRFVHAWGEGARWETAAEANAPHEANFLKLDCSKIRSVFGWKPVWDIDQAVRMTVAWTKAWVDGQMVISEMDREIEAYLQEK